MNLLISFFFYFYLSNTAIAAKFDNSSNSSDFYTAPHFKSHLDFQEVPPISPLSEQKKYLKTNYFVIEKLIDQQQYAEARLKLESHLNKNKSDPNLYNLLGKLDSLENKILSAKDNFNKSISLNNNNLLAYQGLAKISLDEQKPAKTKTYIDKMFSIDKNYYGTYLLQSDYFILTYDVLKAETSLLIAYDKVKGNVVNQVKILSILGKLYTIQNNQSKILLLAKNLYLKNDNNLLVLSFYATNLAANTDFIQAQTLLQKIIELNTKDITHRILLAKILSSQANKNDEVVALFDKAFSLNRKNLNILVLKASFLTKLEEYERALSAADQLIAAAPSSSNGYQLKGDIYKASNKNAMAIKMYQLALQKNSNSSAVFSLADLLAQDKQFSKAINLLRLQFGKNKNDTLVFFKLALIYEKKGDLSQTESYYKKVLKISPTHVLSLNNLALLYIQKNNSNALLLAEKAFNITENSAAITDTYGYAQVLFGQTEQGLKTLKDAEEQAPNILDIQFHIAIAHNKLGFKNDAIQILEKITLNKQGFSEGFSEKENAISLLQKLQEK